MEEHNKAGKILQAQTVGKGLICFCMGTCVFMEL